MVSIMDFTSDSIQLDQSAPAQDKNASQKNTQVFTTTASISSALSPSPKRNIKRSKTNKRESSLFYTWRSSSFFHQSDSSDEIQDDFNDSSGNLTNDVDAKQLKLIALNEERSKLLQERQKLKKEIENFKTQLKTIDHENSKNSKQNAYEQLFSLRLHWALNLPNRLNTRNPHSEITQKPVASSNRSKTVTVGPFDSLDKERANTFDMKPMVNIEHRRKYLQNQYPLLRINEALDNQDDIGSFSVEIDIDGFRFSVFTKCYNGQYYFKVEGDFLSLNLASKESRTNLNDMVKLWAKEGNIQNVIHSLYSIIEFNNTKRDFYQDILQKFMRYNKKIAESPSNEWLNLEDKGSHVTIFWEIEVDENGIIQNALAAVKNFENDKVNFTEKISELGLKEGIYRYLLELFPLD